MFGMITPAPQAPRLPQKPAILLPPAKAPVRMELDFDSDEPLPGGHCDPSDKTCESCQ